MTIASAWQKAYCRLLAERWFAPVALPSAPIGPQKRPERKEYTSTVSPGRQRGGSYASMLSKGKTLIQGPILIYVVSISLEVRAVDELTWWNVASYLHYNAGEKSDDPQSPA